MKIAVLLVHMLMGQTTVLQQHLRVIVYQIHSMSESKLEKTKIKPRKNNISSNIKAKKIRHLRDGE